MLVAEGALRLIPDRSCEWFDFVQADERFGWMNRPNNLGVYCCEECRTPAQINSKGLRDREIAYEKGGGVFRILVLGDSFMEGYQVALRETMPKVLERKLRAAASEWIEVINGGVGGFGTDNELLFFTHEGVKYGPDLTMLALYLGNDLIDNSRELGPLRPYMLYLSKRYLVREPGGWIFRAYPIAANNGEGAGMLEYGKAVLRDRSKLYRFLRARALGWLDGRTMEKLASWGIVSRQSPALRWAVEKALRPDIPYNMLPFVSRYTPAVEEAVEVTKELLVRLRDEVEAHNSKLFIFLIPWLAQFDPAKWTEYKTNPAVKQVEWDLQKPNRLLARFLESKGILYLDLLPHFTRRKESGASTGYFLVDGHWTKAGHEFAAEVVGSELMRRRLVPAR